VTTHNELIPILKKLRMSGVLESFDLRSREAAEDNLSHAEFTLRLLSDEVERRDAKNLSLRMRRAHFESDRTINDFDFEFNPTIPKAKVVDLATCGFVAKKEVVFLIGQSGVGKSHLAQAIGQRACMAGHAVLYTPAHQMFRALRAARADMSLDRTMLRYTTPDLLIIDDLGLRPLQAPEPDDLYEVIQQRYERGAMVITSNRATDEWYPMFGDPLLASAAMDRLLHHAHVIEMVGDSYRNPTKKRKGAKSP
jgi:DNA replication protein DnaC